MYFLKLVNHYLRISDKNFIKIIQSDNFSSPHNPRKTTVLLSSSDKKYI